MKTRPGGVSLSGLSAIAVLSLETGEQRILIENGKQAKYLETGHLIYEQSGNLMAALFNPETLEVTSTPVPVLQVHPIQSP